MNNPSRGSRTEINGWIHVIVAGTPYECGYAHGYQIATELKDVMDNMNGILMNEYGLELATVVDIVNEIYGKKFRTYEGGNIYREIEGIRDGCGARKYEISTETLIFWNTYYSLDYIMPMFADVVARTPALKNKYGSVLFNKKKLNSRDRCTGFMATGNVTKDKGFVIAHNTFDTYRIDGVCCNVILEIAPVNGARILMQCPPGFVSSGTDFYLTDWGNGRGFVVTETTLGGFHNVVLDTPVCCRIRHAVQYAEKLEDFEKILCKGNGGDYANAWLIADRTTNEIMRIELGNRFVSTERTKDGYFIGFNAPYDDRIRNLESSNTGFNDVRRHQGARRVRLTELMNRHNGRLTAEIAKSMLADHHDVYLGRTNPCSRTCCSHYDLDDRAFMSDPTRPLPFQPQGAIDGIVCDASLAKSNSFAGRWGSSCGAAFNVGKFIKKHVQWDNVEKYLRDRPSQPWTVLGMGTRKPTRRSANARKKQKGGRSTRKKKKKR